MDTVNGESTAVTAAGAITMPTPESRSTPGASMSSAEPSSAVVTCALVAVGLADLTSAAMAAAVGADAEVPQKVEKPGVVVEPQSDAARSTFASVVPPPVPNRMLPGVITVPFGL